jgi:hypothetical protein
VRKGDAAISAPAERGRWRDADTHRDGGGVPPQPKRKTPAPETGAGVLLVS